MRRGDQSSTQVFSYCNWANSKLSWASKQINESVLTSWLSNPVFKKTLCTTSFLLFFAQQRQKKVRYASMTTWMWSTSLPGKNDTNRNKPAHGQTQKFISCQCQDHDHVVKTRFVYLFRAWTSGRIIMSVQHAVFFNTSRPQTHTHTQRLLLSLPYCNMIVVIIYHITFLSSQPQQTKDTVTPTLCVGNQFCRPVSSPKSIVSYCDFAL